MKKKLEAELISLAHRILQLKNKSEVAVLQQQALKLYEKLSVLRFVEENFGEVKPTIGQAEIEADLEKIYNIGTSSDQMNEGENPQNADQKVSDKNPGAETNAGETPDAGIEPESNASGEAEKEISPEQTTPGAESEETKTQEAQKSQELEPETGENAAEIPQTEVGSDEKSENEFEEKPEQENIETPTFDAGTDFEQPEAVDEIDAIEAKPDEDFNWENASEIPAAETNTETPENNEQDDVFAPSFELSFEPKDEQKPQPDKPSPQFTFDDLLGKDYADPIFVKPEENEMPKVAEAPKQPEGPIFGQKVPEEPKTDIWARRPFENTTEPEWAATSNEKLSKGIIIGLNDRIAFMKNLFGNSSEDYNRVLSQLITFDNFDDARNFINDMVKPDYNNWEGKEEYEQRFMEIVEKRFS